MMTDHDTKTKEIEPTWQKKRRSGDLAPNPELWAALGNGDGLRDILTEFYGRVYEDPKLSTFFEGVTLDRAIGKQYSFLMEIFTGQKVYFGERPRNAHHWMVVSQELFDYRERLFEECARAWGLADQHIRYWLAVHEVFRRQIVKEAPIPKKVRGVSLPLEGHEWLVLTVGSLCDGCQGVLAPETRVAYHLRTGRTYCQACGPHQLGYETSDESDSDGKN